MAISVVQTTTVAGFAASTSFPSGLTLGNWLFITGSAYNTSAGPPTGGSTPTIGGLTPATTTLIAQKASPGSSTTVYAEAWVISVTAALAGAKTVAMTFGSDTGAVGIVGWETTGWTGTPTLDQAALTANGTSNAPSSGTTAAIGNAPEFIAGWIVGYAQSETTPVTGYTTTEGSGSGYFPVGYRIAVSSGGTFVYATAATGSANWSAGLYAFYSGGAGPVTGPLIAAAAASAVFAGSKTASAPVAGANAASATGAGAKAGRGTLAGSAAASAATAGAKKTTGALAASAAASATGAAAKSTHGAIAGSAAASATGAAAKTTHGAIAASAAASAAGTAAKKTTGPLAASAAASAPISGAKTGRGQVAGAAAASGVAAGAKTGRGVLAGAAAAAAVTAGAKAAIGTLNGYAAADLSATAVTSRSGALTAAAAASGKFAEQTGTPESVLWAAGPPQSSWSSGQPRTPWAAGDPQTRWSAGYPR